MLNCEIEELNEENRTHQLTDGAADNVISIKSSKLLTKEQEFELGRRALSGDIDARNELINANYRLVARIAHNYEGKGVPFNELYQEGCLGLIIAASKFDPDRNCRFATYAISWIKKYICRASVRSGFSTTIPRRIEPHINKVLSFARLFEMTNNRPPSVEELSNNLDISSNIIEDVLRFCQPVSSYDDKLEAPNVYSGDFVTSIGEELVISNAMKEEFDKMFERLLTETEKYILRARFYSHSRITKQEISSRLDIPVSEVLNIEKRAFKKIRTYFVENNIDFHSFLPD